VNVLLVPAHPGFPGQIPQSRKTVVCVVRLTYCKTPSTPRQRREKVHGVGGAREAADSIYLSFTQQIQLPVVIRDVRYRPLKSCGRVVFVVTECALRAEKVIVQCTPGIQ